MHQHLARFSELLARFLAVGAGVALVALMGLVCANAAARGLGFPIRGAVESSGLLGALTAALALSYAQVHHNHITGGVAMRMLPPGLRRLSDILACLIALVLYAAASWELLDLGLFTMETGETVDGVGTFFPWFILLTVPGFLGQAVLMICLLAPLLPSGEQSC